MKDEAKHEITLPANIDELKVGFKGKNVYEKIIIEISFQVGFLNGNGIFRTNNPSELNQTVRKIADEAYRKWKEDDIYYLKACYDSLNNYFKNIEEIAFDSDNLKCIIKHLENE